MEPVFTPLRGEDRQAKARANKAAGYRCSQQISCSFAEDLGEDMERLIRLGMPFGSGMGRGIKNGSLDRKKMVEPFLRGLHGLLRCIALDGSIYHCCTGCLAPGEATIASLK